MDRLVPDLVAIFPTKLGWTTLMWRGERVVGVRFGQHSSVAALECLTPKSHRYPFEVVVIDLTRDRSDRPDPTDPTAEGTMPAELSGTQRALVERLTAFAAGQADEFRDVELDLDHLTPFQRKVVAACRQIDYGRTLAYAELAAQAGSPRAARAVGSVMRTNRFPLIVPCHRVVGSGGGLGGYSAPDGLAMKRRLLDMEQGATISYS